jgi:protein-disulfide isomerase
MTRRFLPPLTALVLFLCALAADPVPPEKMQGVDFSGLDEPKKKLAVEILNENGCDCGCGMKLAVCRRDDPTCPRSPGLAAQVVKLVSEGKGKDEIVKSVLSPPSKYVAFALTAGSAPSIGKASAPVTVLHYLDYQCPYCARVAPTIERIAAEYPEAVRVVFKMHPLAFHPQAPLAAEAALAAHAQGKFLPMHKKLIEASASLSREKILALAAEIGLDVPRFTQAIDAKASSETIARETQEVVGLGATGTPATFVNGRFVSGAKPFEFFKAIIDEEIGWAKGGNRPAFTTGTNVRQTSAPAARKGPDPTKLYDLPAGASPSRGPADAPVTILHYTDFQCPVCKRVAPTLDQLAEAYPKSVRIVYKMHPLKIHKQATIAAEAVLAAHAQGKFLAMHDELFERQASLSRETILAAAAEIGLDVARFTRDLDTHAFLPVIEQETKEVVAIGSTATPTSFVNGRFVLGAQPLDAFKKIVDEELVKKGQPLVAR